MNNSSFDAALVCPETRQALSQADAELVTSINALIAEQRITSRGGSLLVQSITAGLVRDDGLYLYPIVDGIAKMIADDAIPLNQVT